MGDAIPKLTEAVSGPGKDVENKSNDTVEIIIQDKLTKSINDAIKALQVKHPREKRELNVISDYLIAQVYNVTKTIFAKK